MIKKTVWIAGTTHSTKQCFDALAQDTRFEITRCITPQAKRVGRKQVLTQNPVHLAAQEKHIPCTLIDTKLDLVVREELCSQTVPDLLLVVDFGYLIPAWLLTLPRVGPLNIHPSLLPRWRGSSPGQYTLLYGETTSAVTLMQMSRGLDEGPIIYQCPLLVQPEWTAETYYKAAFSAITPLLADLCIHYCENPTKYTVQPEQSPTPIAQRFTKDDGFVSWEVIQAAIHSECSTELIRADADTSLVIRTAATEAPSVAVVLERACRAFYPWPGLWTKLLTATGEKRLKIHSCSVHENKLRLETVQVEGKTNVQFSEIKNI